MNERQKGFTLIELLVVIAIIGLLSSIVLASLSDARDKAKAARMVSDFHQIEVALRLLFDAEGQSGWPLETSFSAGSNPDISVLVADTARLGRFLKQAPVPPEGTVYGYDNDGDTLVCNQSTTVTTYEGANIHARGVSQKVALLVDNALDKDNSLFCGRIRWDLSLGGTVYYLMGKSSQDY